MPKALKTSLKALLILALVAGLTAYLILTRKNIHQVESNGLEPLSYRSAQLKPNDLAHLIASKDIDVVLNVRGGSDSDKWYKEERDLVLSLGKEYHSHGFSVYKPPSRERFLDIVNVLEKAKAENKNILIHCKAGADRTGLISAVSQIILYDFPVEKAYKSSLNIPYGHVPNPNGPVEQVLIRYEESTKKIPNISFKEWINKHYSRKEILAYAAEHKAIPESKYPGALVSSN
jgi:protein tyrosine/serine phosphatase